ncbi:MAG TPA: hypothetical protein VNF99_05260 [Stellaceae bacterium]|nr:hypothetical protein [Stellaceae bacterium]
MTLDSGFPLIAYALPQTAQACALAPGGFVDAEIAPTAVHVLASPRGAGLASDT